MFGTKRRFQRCKVWPLSSRSPPYERIKFGYPREKVRFLLLSTNVAGEWLHIDTDLLIIITSTADELSGGTNIDDLERTWTHKIWVLSDFFCYFRLRRTLSDFSLTYTGDRPRQPAYEIKLMLWRVSWALAQISCLDSVLVISYFFSYMISGFYPSKSNNRLILDFFCT